ncbi:MAG: MarR family winged helix-turn-helix transcriptional regulator [Candidatus Dormibacteraceae bacterium]
MSTTPGGVREATIAYLDAVAILESFQTRLWRQAHLTLTQARLLRTLRDGPVGQSELGRALNLSPASVTRLIDRLEERGLLLRERDGEDRRRVAVKLLPSGRRLVGEQGMLRNTPVDLAIRSMTEDEQRTFTVVVRDLVERAHAFAEEAEPAPA